VQVFVDDAVRGDLPSVCVKSGEPATWRVPFVGEVGGRNPLWFLLVFFGPVGWIVLLLGSGTERFEVLLPVSDSTRELWRERRRDRRIAVIGTVLLAGMCLLLARWYGDLGATPFLVIGAGVLTVLVTHWRYDAAGVDLGLDATRRWVTISGVHPDFVAAVRRRDAAREDRSIR
jgi:hypothetical protein